MVLDNGMRVLVKRVPGAEYVAVRVGVAWGSVDDSIEKAGLAHMIEHLVWMNTKNYPEGKWEERVIKELAGWRNGETSEYWTMYKVNVRRECLREVLELLKEVCFEAEFRQNDLEREKEVVLEEIRGRKVNESLYTMLMEAVWGKNHPLGWTVEGDERTVANIGISDLEEAYRRGYVPDSMVVGVVGDVDEDVVLKDATEIFGKISRERQGDRQIVKIDELQQGSRVRFVKRGGEYCYFDLGVISEVGYGHPRRFGLRLLAQILGGRRTGLLGRCLSDELGLSYETGAMSNLLSGANVFTIWADARREKIVEAVVGMVGVIRKLKEGVSGEDIRIAKEWDRMLLLIDPWTMGQTAEEMVKAMIMGGRVWTAEEMWAGVEKVTEEDVNEIVKEIFRPERVGLVVGGEVNETDQKAIELALQMM